MSASIAAPELDSIKLSSERGFLPEQDPLTRLPQAFDCWENAAFRLPKLLVSDRLRQTIEDLPPFPFDAITNDRERERAMVLLSYLGHAYVWTGAKPATVLPRVLAIPWHAVAASLGRPPVLSYNSYALQNYFRFDPHRDIECGNIGLIQNFWAGADEEWFILIHVDIERKAAGAMAVLHDCLDAAESRDTARLDTLLAIVHHSVESMLATLRRMPELCDPYIYYHRVRPYIHGWKNHPDLPEGLIYEGVDAYQGKPQQFRGETGAQSAIVPALDALLGVAHAEDILRTYLMEMRDYMPPAHRAFIESIEARGSIRNFVERTGRTEAYNACVDALHRFRSLHLEYAASYIFRYNPQAIGTGGTPFMQYLKKHRDETGGVGAGVT